MPARTWTIALETAIDTSIEPMKSSWVTSTEGITVPTIMPVRMGTSATSPEVANMIPMMTSTSNALPAATSFRRSRTRTRPAGRGR